MKNDMSCAIVRDLLPSYVDGLTSEETTDAVERHLAGCEDCRESRRLMGEAKPAEQAAGKEVDYLKKVHRRSTRRSLIIGVALMLISVSLLSFRFFYIGSEASAETVACHVTVEGDTVTVAGTLTSSGMAVSRVTFSDSAGIVRMKVYAAPVAFWNSGDFSESYTAGSDVIQVCCGDLVAWENGVEISKTTARLFNETNPFVGDMPSNSRIATILGVSGQLGPFTNELQTTSEPYGWTLLLEDSIASGDEAMAREIMAADSYVMLAAIGNLGYVTWEYRTDEGARQYTVTQEEASAYVGGDVKECARSASELQALLESLSIKLVGVR